mmetsp:Transcript_6636/g.11571  ORF Transcript_6636/g.11571 Transcript_6636/m.11571 type:complete len:435 (+) Transcript_6636:64-1368(+)
MSTADDLPDFDGNAAGAEDGEEDGKDGRQEGAADIRASGFRDFVLKPEVLQAIVECGFEHPSEVQHACIPQALLGTDILCQAKSGMGKTAVFVLACLTAIDLSQKVVRVLVLGHTRELAYQIEHEFLRLGKKLAGLRVAAVYGGTPIEADKTMLKNNCPHVLVATPGRALALLRAENTPLKLDNMTHFILDECDRCIDELDLRKDVQQIFIKTPKRKQVMMFSATMGADTRTICKRFMQNPHEISVESEAKLTLHGLLQYYVKLEEKSKIKKLIDLLDSLEFNQVVVFVKSVKRALALDGILRESNFPSMTLHELPKQFQHKADPKDGLSAANRIERLKLFKEFKNRILVTTDLFGRGMDVERVNIVINFDIPADDTMYLHRVGRAGRFGTKGLAITFMASTEDEQVLKKVQSRFEVTIGEMPDAIDQTSYLNA